MIVRSPDAMDLGWASASLAFRANNAGIMRVSVRTHHIRTAEVAEIGEVAKIVANQDDLMEAIRQIRATAVSMPKKEREILDEGVNQHSASGTKGFVQVSLYRRLVR